MVFTTIRKPENTITWSKQEPVQTQYFTTQLSTLTYSTTGVMSSTTSGTFYTTAEATTISSNVSYSYQEGNIYSTSMTSTTIALPDGRTVTSFGTMTTELKYSYYPNRKQTGEKYVAVSNNYVGNIYSTIASSTRSSCIIFEQEVNKTIDTFISSIYTPAYTVNTTISVSTTAQTTTETSVYSTVESNFTHYMFYNTTKSTVSARKFIISSSNGTTETRPAELLVLNAVKYFDNRRVTLTSGDIFYSNATTTLASTQPNNNYFHISDVSEWTVTLHRYFKKGSSLISYTDSFVQSDLERSYIGSTLDDPMSISTFQYTNRVNTVTYRTNAWVSTDTTTTAETSTSVNTTSIIVPDFDGKISAHNIADSMYYSLNYTYPFESTKTSYILHGNSITHQYYKSTTKEVTA